MFQRSLRRSARWLLPMVPLMLSLAGLSAAEEEREALPPYPVSMIPAPRAPYGLTEGGPAPFVFCSWEGIFGGFIPPDVNCPACAYPPDPHGAIGAKGVIQVVNTAIGYFARDRSSSNLTWNPPVGTEQFFGITQVTHHKPVDAKAVYDPGAQRFIVVAIEYGDDYSRLHVAVSKTSDPRTPLSQDWYVYDFDITQTVGTQRYAADYPALGFDGQAIYVAARTLSLPLETAAVFLNCSVYVLNKAEALNGTLSTYARVNTPNGVANASNLQPVTVVGSNGPGNVAYFADVSWTDPTKIRIWALTDPLGSRVLTSALVSVPNFGGQAPCAPQSGTSLHLDSFDPTAQGNAFWRDGALWFCHTGGGSLRAIVYYYQVATNGFPSGSPGLIEAGGIDGGAGVFNYQPAIYGNLLGDVCIVFSQSSAVLPPRIMATARRGSSGGFPPPMLIQESPTFYNGSAHSRACGSAARWGDFGSVAVDPFDQSFWVTHELPNGTTYPEAWTTVWANIAFAPAFAGWVPDGVPLRSSYTRASAPQIVPDGNGGAFFAWLDGRLGGPRLAIGRLLATGEVAPGWPAEGVLASTGIAPGSQGGSSCRLVSDNAGGVFGMWSGFAGLWVQRIDGTGNRATGWPSDAVYEGNGSSADVAAAIQDGAGGLCIVWLQGGEVRAQRFRPDGTRMWVAGGVVVGTSDDFADATSDGSGGLIVSWGTALHAQRLAGTDGAKLWGASGIDLGLQGFNPRVTTDGAGGAFVVWSDVRSGSSDLYALRITGNGGLAQGWPSDGLPVVVAPGDQVDAAVAADHQGGCLIAWSDTRSGTADVYAQRITADAHLATGWALDGVPATTAAGEQTRPALTADGAGGAFIAWEDALNIAVSHVAADGARDENFGANGNSLCGAPGRQSAPQVAMTGVDTAVVVWEDGRTCTFGASCTNGIFAQHVTIDTAPPAITEIIGGGRCYDRIHLAWTAPGDDGSGGGGAAAYDLRTSPTPITPAMFSNAIQIATSPPLASGTHEELTYPVPYCSGVMYYAIKTRDEAHNWSAMSNVTLARPLCPDPPASCDSILGVSPVGTEATFALRPIEPNPLQGNAEIRFEVPTRAWVRLEVLDVTGRHVRTLVDQEYAEGVWSVEWDRDDDSGRSVSAGLYFFRMSSGGFRASHRAIVLPSGQR